MAEIGPGRPSIDFDWDKFDTILQFKPSIRTCRGILNVSEDTIERRIRDKFDLTFNEYRDMKMAPVKLSLVQKALEQARSGNTAMLIFCLKNLCGWMDKPEESIPQNKEIYTPPESMTPE